MSQIIQIVQFILFLITWSWNCQSQKLPWIASRKDKIMGLNVAKQQRLYRFISLDRSENLKLTNQLNLFVLVFPHFWQQGNSLGFKVDNSLAFEIPLVNVTNSTTAKNEVTIEFHQNDDAAVSLMEVRFHVPPDPDSEKDPVAVSH